MIELAELNGLPTGRFVDQLEGIFEHSPWIPERAAAARPFESRLDLLDALRAVVRLASPAQKLGLINAHPRLGERGRPRQQLTQASSSEQRRAGLDACSDAEFAELERMNASYQARFEIPFILAVRGHDPPSILAQMRRRLTHERSAEIEAALHQVGLIAAYRLADTVANVAAAEVAAMLRRLADGARDALALEWMRAAGLTVRQDVDGTLLGMMAASDAPMPGSLLLGVHQSSESSPLHYQGQVGWVCAVAVLQRLKEQGTPARGDVAVVARTADAALGVAAVLAQLDPDRTTVVQLPLAQLPPMRVAIVPAGGMRADQQGALDAATGALRGFLLHTSNHE